MVHKIALNGYGRIGRTILTAGSYSVNYSDSVAVCPKSTGMHELQLPDVKSIINQDDFKSLTDIYKKVKRKYHPESSFLKKEI